MSRAVKRGDVITVAVSGDCGQPRPAVVIQSDALSESDGVLVAMFTSALRDAALYRLTIEPSENNGLKTPSGSFGEEVLTIAKNRSTAPAATWEDEEHLHYRVDRSWQNEAEHFLDAVINGAKLACGTAAQALRVMQLIDRIYEQGDATPKPQEIAENPP